MDLRFTLSYRDVEDLLAGRGVEVAYETILRWVLTFGPAIARRLRARRPTPHRRWHLDEMFVRIGGKPMYLWRAVDCVDQRGVSAPIGAGVSQPSADKFRRWELARPVIWGHGLISFHSKSFWSALVPLVVSVLIASLDTSPRGQDHHRRGETSLTL